MAVIMFSVLVSVCNEVLPLALGTKRLLSLMTLWIGQEGVEKKTQKKAETGAVEGTASGPETSALLLLHVCRETLTDRCRSPRCSLSLLTFTSVLVILEVNWSLCAFVQVTARRDRAVTVIQQKGVRRGPQHLRSAAHSAQCLFCLQVLLGSSYLRVRKS